ncbi:putative Ig domain-containing protein [Kaistella palustris]|uniref:putative Ig domain-containing protein n=1 Tax=Kaistella palustris TaxID=493376 RepID=UPI000421437F|nr:putative Ig domain-containing protein [Kaistella palustris]
MRIDLLFQRMLFLMVFAFSGLVLGQYYGSGTFNKITSLAELTDGYYVIANKTDEFAMNSSTTQVSGSLGYTGIIVKPIVNPPLEMVWKIETIGADKTIYNEGVSKFVSYTGSSNNVQLVDAATSNNQKWTVTYSSGVFLIKNKQLTTRFLQYNAGAPRFACYTGSQQDLQLYKLASPTGPVITATPTSLSGFTNIEGSGPSTEQSFNVSGSNLTDNVTATAPAAFEISKASGSGFADILTFAPTSGTLTSTVVYVRMKAGLSPAAYSGNISISSTDATSVDISLNGIVSPMPVRPVITTPSAQTGTVGVPYSYQLVASENPDSYARVSGSLPDGVNLNTSTGEISGTPSAAGTFSANFTATNAAGTSDPVAFEITVAQGTQTATLPDLNKQIGDAVVMLPATTDAGITIAYSSSDMAVASVSGNTLTVGGAGTATITASNAGSADYAAFNDTFTVTVTPVPPLNHLVISQIYGAGGNSGATYNRDYVELYNPTNSAISLNGYTLQYASASGTGSWTNNSNNYLPNVSVEPGNYFLIQTTTSGTNGALLPTPDYAFNTSMDMSGTTGKVALVSTTHTLSGPLSGVVTNNGDIVDLVGFGTANYYEGSAAAPASSVTNAVFRKNSGKQDTNVNGDDFEALAANPRNSLYFTTMWAGLPAAWSNGTPNDTKAAVIDADYAGPAFTSQTLTVNENKTLTVSEFVKTGDVTNNGKIIVDNNANFVQTGSFTAGANSSFKVNRSTRDVSRLDYVAWSSPLQDAAQTLKEFSPQTLDVRFLTYNNGLYVKVPNPNVPFSPAQGYLIRTPNNFVDYPATEKFNGVFEGSQPNHGVLSYDPSVITGEYVFLGNPYPSAVSMETFYAANPQINGSFYIWDSVGAKMDAEGKYSGSNYVTTTMSGSVPAGSSPYVPVAQGFFINRGTDNTPLVFNDGMRQTTETGNFAKISVTDKFWLQMTAPSGAKPQMLIAFNENATSGYDKGLDAKMLDSNADVIYSTVDTKPLVINTLGTFGTDDMIKLSANFLAAGNYTISIAKKEGLFSNGQKIYLKDHLLGTDTELTSGDYSFAATEGINEDRFTVSFSRGMLGSSDLSKNQTVIYAVGQTVHIKGASRIRTVELYDMSGKMIKKAANVNSQNTEVTVTSKGVALVKILLETGETVTKKIIIN